MGQGVQSARQGVQKVSQAKAHPTELHLQPLPNKIRTLVQNLENLHTCSNAKTHNTKVISFFKTIPTV